MHTYYECDPIKNTECLKIHCASNPSMKHCGCHCTSKIEYAKIPIRTLQGREEVRMFEKEKIIIAKEAEEALKEKKIVEAAAHGELGNVIEDLMECCAALALDLTKLDRPVTTNEAKFMSAFVKMQLGMMLFSIKRHKE